MKKVIEAISKRMKDPDLTFKDTMDILIELITLSLNYLDSVFPNYFEKSSQEKWKVEDLKLKAKDQSYKLLELVESIKEQTENLVERNDEIYEMLLNSTEELQRKIDELPEIKSNIKFPYNIERLITVAQSFSDLDDNSWKRVISLAKALKESKK